MSFEIQLCQFFHVTEHDDVGVLKWRLSAARIQRLPNGFAISLGHRAWWTFGLLNEIIFLVFFWISALGQVNDTRRQSIVRIPALPRIHKKQSPHRQNPKNIEVLLRNLGSTLKKCSFGILWICVYSKNGFLCLCKENDMNLYSAAACCSALKWLSCLFMFWCLQQWSLRCLRSAWGAGSGRKNGTKRKMLAICLSTWLSFN